MVNNESTYILVIQRSRQFSEKTGEKDQWPQRGGQVAGGRSLVGITGIWPGLVPTKYQPRTRPARCYLTQCRDECEKKAD